MIPSWISSFLNKDGCQKIEDAIIAAEKTTQGEIVPIIVKSSSTTGHIPLMLYSIGLLLYYVSGITDILQDHEFTPSIFAIAWGVILIPLSAFVSKLPIIQRLFVSSSDRSLQTQTRALNEFYQAGLHNTQGATGILLFISLVDQKAVVLADQAISKKLPQDTWSQVVTLLLDGAKKRDLASGYCQAIQKCGEILAQHFPILPDDVDELPNKLIIKD